MPAKERPGLVGLYVELPEDLRDRFKAFADANGNAFVAELRLAMECHLVRPLSARQAAKVMAESPAVRPRGRPRKNQE